MNEYRYSLDKSSKKNICPNCNKNTFVYYVDTVKGEYLPTDFGRCDREQNCKYHKAPPKGKKAFLIVFCTVKKISEKAYKLVDVNGTISIVPKSQILELNLKSCYITEWYLKTSTIQYLNNESKYFNTENTAFINDKVQVKPEVTKEPTYHNLEILDTLYNDTPTKDNLTEYLSTIFTPDEVFKATQNYFISGNNHYWNNSTLFWQIDNKEQIHACKIMLYNNLTGKRVKEPYNCINWLHNALKEHNFNLKQCLFGLHLINTDYQKEIAIVESEKTAIIMSIFLPQFIWIATGSKSNFKIELLQPLKKRKCIAFPDKGEFDNWNTKATDLNQKGFKIAVSNILEKTSSKNGFDLADYYLNN
ncbi:hypothetical protein H0I29_07750 [Polaribacter sp. R2A056_3_33]|uniref:DUF6371 domain-containing protein n=1 Tax=Polaribacter sp. R2A056_3_33 TaxID=2745563 RepID=UPI001C4E6E78|nr:DUF6371 domain-containing protein [Polaribacter sp. R2A056_3_33]QXP71948.1 hypothetical protein H0I29_07750 [Polaribacter sp. R2A056_3_33]